MARLNTAAADKAVSFIESLSHTKGKWAGVKFTLAKWQREDIIRPLFGTLNADGKRRYRTAYIEIPRKNGKSEVAAAISLKLPFVCERLSMKPTVGAAASATFSPTTTAPRPRPSCPRSCGPGCWVSNRTRRRTP